jgi:hypothetical protein
MTLKILFRYHDKPTISRLFQIASVSHSKDDTDILATTGLKPIDEILWIMSDGARFIIVGAKNSSSDSLLV